MTSVWYVEFGSLILFAMVIEIFFPHIMPAMQRMYYGCRRCCDRGCTCDDRKSSQLLQSDYESLYLGPEFMLDARLAQIIAFVWVVFMFSHVMPLMFPIALVNFFMMYWIDKLLLLKFFRIPKNYDE